MITQIKEFCSVFDPDEPWQITLILLTFLGGSVLYLIGHLAAAVLRGY